MDEDARIEQKILEIAIKEWEKLHDGNFPYIIGLEWEYFLKGIECVLSNYRFTEEDVIAVYEKGFNNTL